MQLKEIVGTEPGPHLLIIGGVHGDEFEAPAALRRLIFKLESDDSLKNSLRGRITLVPVVNQSAFLRGWRTGEDDLDLARICPGKADGSVTQRVAHVLSELIRTADYFIDLHSGGTIMDVLPFTGYKLHADESVREKQQQMAMAFNLPVVWATSADLDGRTLSIARDANIPTIYAEYLGSGLCNKKGVDAYTEGCLNVMALLKMIDRPMPKSQVEKVVEDPRPASGHMQICNPSPITGQFDSAVQLGQEIQAGDSLGTVTDNLGEDVRTVTSDKSGIVLVLRTFARVHENDSLAVVMDNP